MELLWGCWRPIISLFGMMLATSHARCVGPCGNITCLTPEGAKADCGPNAQRCGLSFDANALPRFHFRDDSCGINDPNAPFFDPIHGLYHLQYQAHLAIPQHELLANFSSFGPVIGHAISADLVHWAHLPVAFWNDLPYRNLAVFTGSATVVDGVPYVVYPGICGFNHYDNCCTYFLATPSNLSDPTFASWTTLAVIQNRTGDDPTAAWQTAAGEWRFAGNKGTVFSSPAMSTTYWAESPVVFRPPTYNATDGGISCGDLFPLPGPCEPAGSPGCLPPPGTAAGDPTHVYKVLMEGPNGKGGDWLWLGNYSDSTPGSGGLWDAEPWALAQAYGAEGGYASKSFWDSRRKQRTVWQVRGPDPGVFTVADLRWNAGAHWVTAQPIPSLASLRVEPPLFSRDTVDISPGGTLSLGQWPPGVGNASEFMATFSLQQAGSFGVRVLVSNDFSFPITLSYDPSPTPTANISYGGIAESDYMPGYDLPGGDYRVTNVNYTDPRLCAAACAADQGLCYAFTYVVRPPLVGACCLKGPKYSDPTGCAACTSGVVNASGKSVGGTSTALRLLPGDTVVDVRVFVDRTILEIFALNGRFWTALALPASPAARAAGLGAAGMELFVGPGAFMTVQTVAAWHMQSAFVSVQQVLDQARGG